jgi:hypothetical protein
MTLKKVKMRSLKTTAKLPKKQPNRRRSDEKQVKNLSRPGKVATDKTALDRVVIDKVARGGKVAAIFAEVAVFNPGVRYALSVSIR